MYCDLSCCKQYCLHVLLILQCSDDSIVLMFSSQEFPLENFIEKILFQCDVIMLLVTSQMKSEKMPKSIDERSPFSQYVI